VHGKFGLTAWPVPVIMTGATAVNAILNRQADCQVRLMPGSPPCTDVRKMVGDTWIKPVTSTVSRVPLPLVQ